MPVLTYYDILDIPQTSELPAIVAAWEMSDKTTFHKRAYEGLMDFDKKRQLDIFLEENAGHRLVHIPIGDENLLQTGGWVTLPELEFSVNVWPIFPKIVDGRVTLVYEPKMAQKFVELYVMPGSRLLYPQKMNGPHVVEVLLVKQKVGAVKDLEEVDYRELTKLIAQLPLPQPRPFIGNIAQFVRRIPPRVKDLKDLDNMDYGIFPTSRQIVAESVKNFLVDKGFFITGHK